MTIGEVLTSRQFLGYVASYALLGWGGLSLLVALGLPGDLGAVARMAGLVSVGAFAALYLVAARTGGLGPYLLACAGWAAVLLVLAVLGLSASGGHGAAAFAGAALLVVPAALAVPAVPALFAARAAGPAGALLTTAVAVWVAGLVLEALSRRLHFPEPVRWLLEKLLG